MRLMHEQVNELRLAQIPLEILVGVVSSVREPSTTMHNGELTDSPLRFLIGVFNVQHHETLCRIEFLLSDSRKFE